MFKGEKKNAGKGSQLLATSSWISSLWWQYTREDVFLAKVVAGYLVWRECNTTLAPAFCCAGNQVALGFFCTCWSAARYAASLICALRSVPEVLCWVELWPAWGRRHFPCHTPVPSVPGIHLLQQPSIQGSAWPCHDKLRDFFGEEKLDFFDCLLCEASVKERILPACFPEQAFMADTLQKTNHTAELFGFSRSLSSILEMGRAARAGHPTELNSCIYLFLTATVLLPCVWSA